ncbi:hypothetical protein [Burkholderia ubonensis]|uniref:hypothetical protein n=1 Tax=Burkholderia ubonensis TaxID=101571 RepID=UPI002ABE3009|nr:hypothetical protein [Burkholderia ubonensis]
MGQVLSIGAAVSSGGGSGKTRGRGRAYRDALLQLVDGLGLGARVHFAGQLHNPHPVLAGASILGLGSKNEGVPMAPIGDVDAMTDRNTHHGSALAGSTRRRGGRQNGLRVVPPSVKIASTT